MCATREARNRASKDVFNKADLDAAEESDLSLGIAADHRATPREARLIRYAVAQGYAHGYSDAKGEDNG